MRITKERLAQAKKYIDSCYADTPPGEKLPSVRTMMREAALTRSEIETVIRNYEQRGFLIRIPRVGLIRKRLTGHLILDMVFCHGLNSQITLKNCFFSLTIRNFADLARRHKYDVRMHSIGLGQTVWRYNQIAKQEDSAGFVIVQANSTEVISTFRESGKPVVSLFSHDSFTDVNQVVDSSCIVDMQMEHLIGLGHKRILYLREEYPFYNDMTITARRMKYFQLMAQYGLQIPRHWQSAYPPGEILKALEMSFSRRPFPTALIVYDYDVLTTYNFLKSKGLRIGKDVSVVATDGAGLLADLNPSVASPVSHYQIVSRNVWSLFEKQSAGDFTPQTIEVMLTFKNGRSTGPPPADDEN